MYFYVPLHLSCTGMYQYVLVCTSMYRYIPNTLFLYLWSRFQMLVYAWYILSESCCHNSGINQVYTWFISAHLKSCWPSCSRILIGMQQHTDFGLPGSLIVITARGVPTGHPSGGAGPARRRSRRRRLSTGGGHRLRLSGGSLGPQWQSWTPWHYPTMGSPASLAENVGLGRHCLASSGSVLGCGFDVPTVGVGVLAVVLVVVLVVVGVGAGFVVATTATVATVATAATAAGRGGGRRTATPGSLDAARLPVLRLQEQRHHRSVSLHLSQATSPHRVYLELWRTSCAQALQQQCWRSHQLLGQAPIPL
jgi:hypothetical protein